MISQKTIDKIFSTIRVEEIIGEYVQLKRAGTNFKGLSPFHEENAEFCGFTQQTNLEGLLLWKRWNCHHFPHGNRRIHLSRSAETRCQKVRHRNRRRPSRIILKSRKKPNPKGKFFTKFMKLPILFSKKIFGKPKKEKTLHSPISRNVNCMMTSSKNFN